MQTPDSRLPAPGKPSNPGRLAATHTIAAIQALVTRPAADGNVPTGVTGRSITLHIGIAYYNIRQLRCFPTWPAIEYARVRLK